MKRDKGRARERENNREIGGIEEREREREEECESNSDRDKSERDRMGEKERIIRERGRKN